MGQNLRFELNMPDVAHAKKTTRTSSTILPKSQSYGVVEVASSTVGEADASDAGAEGRVMLPL